MYTSLLAYYCRKYSNIELDYTRGAGGPKGLVSNHLKSAWIGGNKEDGGNLFKCVGDA